MDSKEKIVSNAASAARRLGGNKTRQSEYDRATSEFKAMLLPLDKIIEDDVPLDPVTGLRSALDQLAALAELPADASLENRVRGLLKRIITTESDGVQLGIEKIVAINMVRSFGLLGAAITSPNQFIENNQSAYWDDPLKTEALFAVVAKSDEVLPFLATGADTGARILSIQNEMYYQLTGNKIDLSPPPLTKMDKAKKVGDAILGPRTKNNDRMPWD